MQRTILSCGQGANTTYQSATSTGPFCCPIQGVNMVNLDLSGASGATGTGGYGQSAFAAVYSRLSMVLGKVLSAGTVTSQVNVGGATPQGGNQSCLNAGGAVNSSPVYYYDATDIDAIVAGQGVGFMQTLSTTSIFAAMPSIGVACDTLNQGFCSPFAFAASGAAIYENVGQNVYMHTTGLSVFAYVATGQDYASQAFVASYLQWQTYTGNTDTQSTNVTTAKFASGATWQSPTASSVSVPVHAAGYVGIQYDATDIAAVPAQSYFSNSVDRRHQRQHAEDRQRGLPHAIGGEQRRLDGGRRRKRSDVGVGGR